MTSAISGVGSSSAAMTSYAIGRKERPAPPDPAEMAKNLVAKLDADGNGSINATELASAVGSTTSGTATSNTSSAGTDEVFAALDSDGDGEVSESELSSTLQTIQDSIGLAQGMGGPGGPPPGAGAMGGMPPPPAAQDDSAGSTQPAAADTNDDGTVSQAELLAYYQSNDAASSASADPASATAALADGNAGQDSLSAGTIRTIMELAHAYGRSESADTAAQSLSVAT